VKRVELNSRGRVVTIREVVDPLFNVFVETEFCPLFVQEEDNCPVMSFNRNGSIRLVNGEGEEYIIPPPEGFVPPEYMGDQLVPQFKHLVHHVFSLVAQNEAG